MNENNLVVEEKTQLDERIAKLEAFIKANDVFAFGTLDPNERVRLQKQRLYMQYYSEVLGERIAAF
jgi:hypothetical protein